MRAGLAAARPLVEDVEDQGAAVHDRQLGQLFEVLHLAAGEIVVEDQQVGAQLASGGADLFRLAVSDEGGGVRCLTGLHGATGDLRAGGVGELRQLVEMLLDDVDRLARQDEAHQESPPEVGGTAFFGTLQGCRVRALFYGIEELGQGLARAHNTGAMS